MAYDEWLAHRIRECLDDKSGVTEKRMFGGLVFMVYGNMCCGVGADDLMLRVGPDQYDDLLAKEYARPMDFTGKPLKGMLYISPAGIEDDDDLARWLGRALSCVMSLPPK